MNFLKKRRHFLLILICAISALTFYPKTSKANAHRESLDSDGIKITQIDTSDLSANQPYITVWVENQKEIQSDDLSLSISYFLYPKINHGKSWKKLAQLDYRTDFIALEIVKISSLAPGEKQAVNFEILPNDIAKLNQVPTIFMGELFQQKDLRLLSQQVSLAMPNMVSMVHATALAFDNPNYSLGNLAPQIQETTSGIIVGSEINTKVFSIVLADDYGVGDTQTYFIYGGIIIPAHSLFHGLPDENGVLSNQLIEYDMGNGEVLGGYLRWVRQITNNHKLTFSFYGHGGALMPDIAPQANQSVEAFNSTGSGPVTLPSWITIQPSWITIQPSWITIQPSWITIQSNNISAEESFTTDAHPASIISVKDLALAMKKGSNDGQNPIDVLDLVHCFSLSIEEVHELAPYTETIIGSANYHFFDARMPGQALQDLNANHPAEQIATSIMTSYDEILPAEGYPRTLAVIKSDEVADIKTYWDQTSSELLLAFEKNHHATRSKLQEAYLLSTKYDSTSCDNEFDLGSPDALVDFYEFSRQIGNIFSNDLAVAQSASLTSEQIESAVISVINRSGTPWFTTEEEDKWLFTGQGLSLYADLVGLPDGNGRFSLSWQSAFYNRIPHDFSPTPFNFIASENQQATWADVIQKSWEGYEISAQGCAISIPYDQDKAEVSLLDISRMTSKSENIISADFYIDRPIGNLIVLFEVLNNDEVIYYKKVHSGFLESGNHSISNPITIDLDSLTDPKIKVTVDPDGFILEEDKNDNHLTRLIQ